MNITVGILNYGIGCNIFSIKNSLENVGSKTLIIDHHSQFKNIDKIILPGVGNFSLAMTEIKKNGFYDHIIEFKKPLLGICLGMQILASIGFESGKNQGLNILKSEVKPMSVDGKIPHIGFNKIKIIKKSELLVGLENDEFYFMHSYEMINYENIISLTEYCGHNFVSSVNKDNFFGVQFHPEKSRQSGLKLFKNFINL